MTQEEKYRQQAKVFLNGINKAKDLFKNHKPSIGVVGEHLLSQSLHSLLPLSYGICQGFVIYMNKLSRQCDVILYKKSKLAVKESFGDLKVIQAESVIAVIEVKSSVTKKTFLSTLSAFEKIKGLGVTNCFLFIYGKTTSKSLKRWLLDYNYSDTCNERYFVTNSYLYDWPDIEWLPNAILSLDANRLYNLGQISSFNGDWVGYSVLKIIDSKEMQISCLQEFFEKIVDSTNGESIQMDMNKYSIEDGVELFRF